MNKKKSEDEQESKLQEQEHSMTSEIDKATNELQVMNQKFKSTEDAALKQHLQVEKNKITSAEQQARQKLREISDKLEISRNERRKTLNAAQEAAARKSVADAEDGVLKVNNEISQNRLKVPTPEVESSIKVMEVDLRFKQKALDLAAKHLKEVLEEAVDSDFKHTQYVVKLQAAEKLLMMGIKQSSMLEDELVALSKPEMSEKVELSQGELAEANSEVEKAKTREATAKHELEATQKLRSNLDLQLQKEKAAYVGGVSKVNILEVTLLRAKGEQAVDLNKKIANLNSELQKMKSKIDSLSASIAHAKFEDHKEHEERVASEQEIDVFVREHLLSKQQIGEIQSQMAARGTSMDEREKMHNQLLEMKNKATIAEDKVSLEKKKLQILDKRMRERMSGGGATWQKGNLDAAIEEHKNDLKDLDEVLP